ncbi:conserved hypothetical protein, partial [Ricinus communis]
MGFSLSHVGDVDPMCHTCKEARDPSRSLPGAFSNENEIELKQCFMWVPRKK